MFDIEYTISLPLEYILVLQSYVKALIKSRIPANYLNLNLHSNSATEHWFIILLF